MTGVTNMTGVMGMMDMMDVMGVAGMMDMDVMGGELVHDERPSFHHSRRSTIEGRDLAAPGTPKIPPFTT